MVERSRGQVIAGTNFALPGPVRADASRGRFLAPLELRHMDASAYFRFTDRIDAAGSAEELALLHDEVRDLQAHAMEVRALERRIARRALAIAARPVEREVGIVADSEPVERIAARRRPIVVEHSDDTHAVA